MIFFDRHRSDEYDGALMLGQVLSRQSDVRKLARKGHNLRLRVPLQSFPRIVDAVVSEEGTVELDLELYRDEENRSVISGVIDTQVSIPCQRCLEPMMVSVHADVHIAVVWDDEQARALPKSLDPYIVPQDDADLVELVEDEVLLEIPFVGFHEESECAGLAYENPEPIVEAEPEENKANPFDVLAQLKNK